MKSLAHRTAVLIGLALFAPAAFGHGDVAPQPVNTDALPDVGEAWLTENPYRAKTAGDDVWSKAVENRRQRLQSKLRTLPRPRRRLRWPGA
jgi:hypothetical protein